MALKELLSAGELDIEALKRIKHRVFVVGRFNQHNRTNYPDMYLFTNRPKDSLGKYADNFTNVQSMQYESFVKMLLPAISEKVYRRDRINFVTQVIPEDPTAAEGSSVIDTFNFFFQRAVANSPQGHFAEGKPGLPNELLREGANERGKQIFQLIRQNLTVFSSFQPHTHEIVDAVSQLFERCGRRRFGNSTMPDYAHGDALPAGFPEKLIDYLYAEDSRARFSAEGLEFAGPWAEVQRDVAVKDHFCSVVTSFRDAMLDSAGQHGRLRFDGKTLDQHAVEVLNEYPFEPPRALKTSFQGARDAFNGLRQILRSKVLLSMVLEWLLLEGYDNIEDAVGKKDHQRDRAIENAILERPKENKLAKPVQRASQEERDQFSQDLTNNFEFVVAAILADDKSLESKLAVLPGALRTMAEELRKDKTVRDTLAGVSGQEFGPEYQKSFVDAMKVVILDNLCPALFQLPILTVDELRKFFRQETRSAYLTAVFLATDGRDAVRKIAEDHLEFFQEQIDKATQKIKDPAKIQQVLLRDVIGVLAQPEIKNRLMKGMRVLNEGHAVLQAGSVESVSAMVPIRPDPKLLKEDNETLRNTEIKTEAVTKPLEKIVRSELDERVTVAKESSAARAAASGSTAGASSAGGGSAAAPSAEPSASAEASAAPTPARSDIEQNASSAIDDILNGLPPDSEVAELKEEDITELVDKATAQLTNKPGFVQGVKNDLRAFEQALFMIYQRYNENFDKPTFRNRVERLTLVNLMLLFKKELGLGEVSSNLHHLLLDMVQHLDPKNPDLRKFLKEKSLTLYFDNAFIKDRGITNLRQTLRAQADESLSATVNFVSELRGIKYLMDLLKSDQQAEVVVVNATADEFINFMQADNLNDDESGLGRLRIGALTKPESKPATKAIAPGLVYLADIAFPQSGGKTSFLEKLARTEVKNDRHKMVLPPICVSTSPFVRNDLLTGEGAGLVAAAAAAAAPVVIVGPSPLLTQRNDPFHAYLPAGYMFAAHFLCKPSQDITIENVNVSNNGRFRVIGTPPRMRDRLETVICGEGLDDKYAFAVDFYLYVALTIIGTISGRAVAASGAINPDDIYKHFHKDFGGAPHAESAYLNDALILPATDFSMYAIDAAIAGAATGAPAGSPKGGGQAAKKPVTSRTRLSGVEFTQTGPNGKVTFNITDVQWFNRIRELWGHQLDSKEN